MKLGLKFINLKFNMFTGATIGALTCMINIVKQSNMFKEYKRTLRCTGLHIMVITLAKALTIQT